MAVDDSLKNRAQKDAETTLIHILKHFAMSPHANEVDAAEVKEAVEDFVQLIIEAAVEKGRGQIRG